MLVPHLGLHSAMVWCGIISALLPSAIRDFYPFTSHITDITWLSSPCTKAEFIPSSLDTGPSHAQYLALSHALFSDCFACFTLTRGVFSLLWWSRKVFIIFWTEHKRWVPSLQRAHIICSTAALPEVPLDKQPQEWGRTDPQGMVVCWDQEHPAGRACSFGKSPSLSTSAWWWSSSSPPTRAQIPGSSAFYGKVRHFQE